MTNLLTTDCIGDCITNRETSRVTALLQSLSHQGLFAEATIQQMDRKLMLDSKYAFQTHLNMWLIFGIWVCLRWFSQCLGDNIFLKGYLSFPRILLPQFKIMRAEVKLIA